MEHASEKTSRKKPFFLFLLGTDTKFQQGVSDDYPRGETLSFMAQYLAAQTDQAPSLLNKSETDQAVGFKTPDICLLNGPDTLGREVGQRIAQGLLTVLEALQQHTPPEQLIVAAHSRGACEAMLLLHEIKRLQTCVGPLVHEQNLSLDLAKLVQDSPCPYTKAALEQRYPRVEELTGGKRPSPNLLKALDHLICLAFLIDPVPGTIQQPLLKKTSLSWNDSRFAEPLPAQDYELLIYENERSSVFYPALPSDAHHLLIPGHHGTGSGSTKTQKKHVIDLKNSEQHLSQIQDLVVIKMLRMFKKHGLLNARAVPVDFLHHPLHKLANEEMQRSERESDNALLSLYKTLRQQYGTYKTLEQHTYRFLPSTGARRFALRNGQHVALDTINHDTNAHTSFNQPAPAREHIYLNIEEAFLDIQARLQAEQPAELLQAIQSLLAEAGNMQDNTNKRDSNTTPLAASLHAPKIRNYFLRLLSVAFDRINEHYLRDEMADSTTRRAFWHCLATLARQESCHNQDFLQDLKSAVALRIATTFSRKLRAIEQALANKPSLEEHTLRNIEGSFMRIREDARAVSQAFEPMELDQALVSSITTHLTHFSEAIQKQQEAQERQRRALEDARVQEQLRLQMLHQSIVHNTTVFHNPLLKKMADICHQYRLHLLDELNPAQQQAIDQQLRQPPAIPAEQGLIGQKLRHLYTMQTALARLHETQHPNGEMLAEFQTALREGSECLGMQRSGKLFLKQLGIVLGIILTGIVPGLLCLGVFAYRSDTSVLRVKGKGFVENMEKRLALLAEAKPFAR